MFFSFFSFPFRPFSSLSRLILNILTKINRSRDAGWFLNFLKALLVFYMKIKVFLPVNAHQGSLDNISGVPWANFSLLLVGQQSLVLFLGRPLLPIGWKILLTIRQRRGNLTRKTSHTHIEALAATFIIWINYTPLTIRKDGLK